MKVKNFTRDIILCNHAVSADSFTRRVLGLMFRKEWKDFDGLVLSPCGSIHTFWMRMVIDICFLDTDQRVLKVVSRLKPWRIAIGLKGSCMTLELPAGKLKQSGTIAGDILKLEAE